ncbi:MAG: SOS response-associated peptidase family protein [Pseudomonadota bacterium]|nr:SOS response-associated peptidase family protein [Pseudomonadota bacterium]
MCFSVELIKSRQRLEQSLNAKRHVPAFAQFQSYLSLQKTPEGQEKIKKSLNLKRKNKNHFKVPAEDFRVFPNFYAPVVTQENNQRVYQPMRYRLRPQSSAEEVPSQYNLFNARLDSLETRQSWIPLFGRQHGILPFRAFYEWVERNGRKQLIRITEHNSDRLLYAPCLYDIWQSPDREFVIRSFAIITTAPTPEVLEMGHDRSPIILEEDAIDDWLTPDQFNKEELYCILNQRRPVTFTCTDAHNLLSPKNDVTL